MKRILLALTAVNLRSFRWHPELPVCRRRNDSVDNVRTWFACSLLATMLAGTAVAAAPNGTQPTAVTPERRVSSPAAAPKPGTGNFVQRFIRELRSSGLEVSVGYPTLWDEADCSYSYPVYYNCFGNNPAAPYVVPVVKLWPEEYVDPSMVNGLGRTRPGYSVTYRLDPREAIVFFGRMPPPARYIGLQTWIWTTGWVSATSPWDEAAYNVYADAAGPLIKYLFATVPPVDFATDPPVYGERVQSISSLANNINNVVMEKLSGPPWDQMRYFVITPDQFTDRAVRDVLGSLGVDQGEIFTAEIPPNFEDAPVGPLGLGEDAVDFFTNIRYAMPEDEQAADAWRKSLPLTVLRVRRVSGTPQPFENRWADARTAVDEISDTALSSGLSSLIDAVIARAQSQGLMLDKVPEEMRDLQADLGNFGPHCRAIGMNCLGDNRDASYFLFTPRSLDAGRFYAVVGTLATETDNGTYVGLSVNDASLLKGVLNISDTTLKGSATSYHSEVNDPDKFFVHFFTRDCDAIADLTDGACTTITADMVPVAGDDRAPGDPGLHGLFSAAVRVYIAPGSERGPDSNLQLRPVVLTFY
jgi:hypothetical protein